MAESHVDVFNSPQYLFGLMGHSGILVEDADGRVHLYSYHPVDNLGEWFARGSIAQLADPDDGKDFETFRRACMTYHEDSFHEDKRSVRLFNGYKYWYEPIRRVLRMGVTADKAEAVRIFCERWAKTPPYFNVLANNCEDFVDKALAAGGIVLKGKKHDLNSMPIPDVAFDHTTMRTSGISSLARIDFE